MLDILLERFCKPYPTNGFGERNYPKHLRSTPEFDRIHHPIKIDVGYLPADKEKNSQKES